MAKFVDLTGKRFGDLIVLKQGSGVKYPKSPYLQIYWLVRCDCGKEFEARGGHLTKKRWCTRSCRSCGASTHGLTGTRLYKMYIAAKIRAKKYGIPFTIKIDDVIIPDRCPLLQIPLILNSEQKWHPNLASLDRVIPSLGYIPGNVWVISWKANVMKSNYSLEDFELLTQNLRAKITPRSIAA